MVKILNRINATVLRSKPAKPQNGKNGKKGAEEVDVEEDDDQDGVEVKEGEDEGIEA